jgi:drug/metabolite transporter (DMT)-like permease
LWAISNQFNKIALSRFLQGFGVGPLVILAALVGVLVLPVALLLQRDAFQIGAWLPLLIAINGGLYLLAFQPLLKALRIGDAASAIPILQLVPVFSFILARIFLGEVLSSRQLVGGALVVSGSFLISVKLVPGRGMALSAFIYAVSFLLFKVFARQSEFWTVAVWESVGFIVYAVVVFGFFRPYRRDLYALLAGKKVVCVLAMLSEVINIVAKGVFNYCSLLYPLALAWVGVSFQPIFVLLYSILLGVFLPQLSSEAVFGRDLLQKVAALAVMLVGACVMNT